MEQVNKMAYNILLLLIKKLSCSNMCTLDVLTFDKNRVC
jgi:hypothetical protein